MLEETERLTLQTRMNAEMRRRLISLPWRSESFDALAATPEELDFYGLPPRPNSTDVVAFEIWQQLVKTASVPTSQWFSVLPLTPLDYSNVFNLMTGGGHQETSGNWSGAYTEAEAGRPFEHVFARWKVPVIAAPTGAANNVKYRCSTWIGFDGANPTSRSMPQIGTTQTVELVSGVPQFTYDAWFQWWMRAVPNPPVPIPFITVSANDTVICWLYRQYPFLVIYLFANVTKGQFYSTSMLSPLETVSPPTFAASVGQTTEWIAERPMVLGATDLYPLPHFDRVTFDGGAIETNPNSLHGMSPARLVRMTERRPSQAGQPGQTLVLSRPKFDTTYPDYRIHVGPGLEADML